jgi:23S rRNA pseudouridine2605 synthase
VAERLQKLLAARGLGSRRELEGWIRAGRIKVDGVVAVLGQVADSSQQIEVDGRRIDLQVSAPAAREVLIYHKPAGEVTTRSDPQGRPTVFDSLPAPRSGRWVVIGRLDTNTTGLLLFTNDGELAHRLMHPSSEVVREYRVRVRGSPDAAALQLLCKGVQLEDGPARFDNLVEEGKAPSHSWFRVTLHEGRNREVRRMWAAVGYEVSKLIRIRYGRVALPADLAGGHYRWLDPEAANVM